MLFYSWELFITMKIVTIDFTLSFIYCDVFSLELFYTHLYFDMIFSFYFMFYKKKTILWQRHRLEGIKELIIIFLWSVKRCILRFGIAWWRRQKYIHVIKEASFLGSGQFLRHLVSILLQFDSMFKPVHVWKNSSCRLLGSNLVPWFGGTSIKDMHLSDNRQRSALGVLIATIHIGSDDANSQ